MTYFQIWDNIGVLTLNFMTSMVLWGMSPCRLVGRYQRFGGTYCLHVPTIQHGATTRKTNIDIFTTENLTSHLDFMSLENTQKISVVYFPQ
jgi:hypothetical protein